MQAQDLLLFQAALGLTEPWQVTSVEFDRDAKRLDLRVDFPKGATFCCPECDRPGLTAYDSEEKTWRHMDFWQHQTYLTARVPRVQCPEHKVRQVALPWARERSGFTLLFEALIMAMVREMPVKAVAGLVGEDDKRVWRVGEDDKRVWRVVHHYVDRAVDQQNLEAVTRVGVDETSSRRGPEYVSVFADLDERRGVFCVEGRAPTVRAASPSGLRGSDGRATAVWFHHSPNTRHLTVRLWSSGGDVRHDWLVLGIDGGLTQQLSVGPLGPDFCPLSRPSSPEDHCRDLIGAWHRPGVRPVRQRSASPTTTKGSRMIVIGVDVHKRTHTLAAIDGITARELAVREVKATDAGHLDALRFAVGLGDE